MFDLRDAFVLPADPGVDCGTLTHRCHSIVRWVLITLMTAGLVVVIWALAGPALAGLFEQAISRVAGF
ncbi:hypothetical protein [Microbacterium sp. NPDC055357]